MITDNNFEKYPAIAKALNRGDVVEVHKEDAEFIKNWFRKHGLIVKISNEFKTNQFRKIQILFNLNTQTQKQ